MQVESSFPKPVTHSFSADELCAQLNEGQILHGNPKARVTTIAAPDTARQGSLIFLNTSGEMLEHAVRTSQASLVVVETEIDQQRSDCTTILVEDARAWYIHALHRLFDQDNENSFDANGPLISPKAAIIPDVRIGPGTVIGAGCQIGSGTKIGSNCVIHPGTHIGEHCFIQDGSIVGSVGLGYHFTASGERLFFPHMGSVKIGNEAIIGAGCVIVRGQLCDTVLGNSVRLGNLINIGHNVGIGDETVLSSNCSVAGGVRIGQRCNIAVGVTINAKIMIGDDATVGLASAVTKSIPAKARVFGNPARPLPTLRKF